MCLFLFFSSRRWHTICALVTGVQTCALPISRELEREAPPADLRPYQDRFLQLNPPPASPEPGEVLGLDGERGRAADARRTLENGGLDAPALPAPEAQREPTYYETLQPHKRSASVATSSSSGPRPARLALSRLRRKKRSRTPCQNTHRQTC